MAAASHPTYRALDVAVLRAGVASLSGLPALPELTAFGPTATEAQREWICVVWSVPQVREALSVASPDLANEIDVVAGGDRRDEADVRRATLALLRYLLRMAGRATPFGLFAGVGAVSFGSAAKLTWGTGPVPLVQASAGWLTDLIVRLESDADVFRHLTVMANSTMTVRGGRLLVPHQPAPSGDRQPGAVEVSLRCTAPVRAAVVAARAPVGVEWLVSRLCQQFGVAELVAFGLVRELLDRGALISSLHAPSTRTDPLSYVVDQLDAAGAETVASIAGLMAQMRTVHADIGRHNAAPSSDGRDRLTCAMRQAVPSSRYPLAVDVDLDVRVTLPDSVARDAERAAVLLARLAAYPYGVPAWRDYHQRFYEQYGIGSLVPLRDVVDPGCGLGFPDGYPNAVSPARRPPLSVRDELLLHLAQQAALDGVDEVVLDDELLARLQVGKDPLRLPPHLEIGLRIDATDVAALDRGDYRVEVATVSRGAGGMTGRFLDVLDPATATAHMEALRCLPTADPGTVCAQMSFPPLDPATAHVARARQVFPYVISLAEHRPTGDGVLTVDDLAVGCDGRRLYLAAPGLGRRVEPVGLHALNRIRHTPPLARFLLELGRAQCAQVTAFDWGAAHRTMPFLPRVRVGRIVLAPARWRLDLAELSGRRVSWPDWCSGVVGWRARRRLPRWVYLVEADRRLPLDLDDPAHQVLLRTHVNAVGRATMTEAPSPELAGWAQGRPAEVVVAVRATQPPNWPPLPTPNPARVVDRSQPLAPAISDLLLAELHGDGHRQDDVICDLPRLLRRFTHPVQWWVLRFRNPDPHLRLRIRLPVPDAFGPAAAHVSAWVDELRHRRLLREVRYVPSVPETGRWGDGPAMAAVEEFFAADSTAVLAQLQRADRPERQALTAANLVDITCAFCGSTAAGMQWLIKHLPPAAPQRIARPLFSTAVRIANPAGDYAALRATSAGAAIVDSWAARRVALAAYRRLLRSEHTVGIQVDDVVASLLHAHHIRVAGIDFDDEDICRHLARAAALAWHHRTLGRPT